MEDIILIVLSCLFVFSRTTKNDGLLPESDKLKRLRFAINVVFIHFPDRQTCHLFCSEILSRPHRRCHRTRARKDYETETIAVVWERPDTGTLTTFIRDGVDHNMIIDDPWSRVPYLILYKLKLIV